MRAKIAVLILFLSHIANALAQMPTFSNSQIIKQEGDVRILDLENKRTLKKDNSKNNAALIYKMDSVLFSFVNEDNSVGRGTIHFVYNSLNQNNRAVQKLFRETGELRSQTTIDYIYNDGGDMIEYLTHNRNIFITSTNEAIEQIVERKRNFTYDEYGNKIEEIGSVKTNQDQNWISNERKTFAFNELNNLIREEAYSYDFSQLQWRIREQTLYFYEPNSNRQSFTEYYSFPLNSSEATLDRKAEFTYDETSNRIIETVNAFETGADGVLVSTPSSRHEYILNSQNQLLDYRLFDFDPLEILVQWVVREYDDYSNLLSNYIIQDEDYFDVSYVLENFEVDTSISMSTIYLPHLFQEPMDYSVSFNSMFTKLSTFDKEKEELPWIPRSNYKYYYSKFAPRIELEEGTFVYPNPASAVLNTIYPANTQFRLYNTLGQVVFETTTTIDNQILNLPPLVTGTYIYKSSIDDGKVVVR